MVEALTIHPQAVALVEQGVDILRRLGATEVYVFGSATSGRWVLGQSDLDFAERGIRPQDFYSAVGQLLTRIEPASSDLVDLDDDTPFTRYLQRKGKLLRVG